VTNREWKRRCVERIHRAVEKAGRIRLRELKRATNYNRGPEDESIPLWYEALDHLEQSGQIVVERDADGMETHARIAKPKQVSSVTRNQGKPIEMSEIAEL
jgi:hypothetical protein